MTKTKLLLVSLFLVCGLVAMAPSAMATQWNAGANTYNYGRAEGHAETTGQVTLGLQTGGTTSAGSYFTITYQAPITELSTVYIKCSGIGTSPWALGNCVDLDPPTISSSGTTTATTNNVLTIKFTNNQNFTNNDQSQIAVTVRLDIAAVAPATCPEQIYAQAQAFTPNGGIQISLSPANPTGYILDVLQVNCPSLSFEFDSFKAKGYTTADVLTCIGVKDVASYENDFILNVDEEFVQALTSESTEMQINPGGGINGSEFPSPVSNGSNFVVTFTNVPTTIWIKAEAVEPCSTLTGGSLTGDPFYCAGGKLNVNLVGSPVGANVAGTVSFLYVVTSTDGGSPENVDLDFKFWSHGPLGPMTLPYTVTANVAYAPTITSPLPIPYFTGLYEPAATPWPGTVECPSGTCTVIEFYNCDTNLLYPFVTNLVTGPPYAYNNLGTTVLVANTTWDPLATAPAVAINPQEQEGSAVPQSGTCTFWMFPTAGKAFADGSALSTGPLWFTSPTIWAGGTYGFDLGSTPFAGQTGYIWAKCMFQNAHGIAWVTDGYGVGEPGLALTVPAIVIPTPEFYHRSPAGDGLGESAVAPIAVNKYAQKSLFYGVHNGAGH